MSFMFCFDYGWPGFPSWGRSCDYLKLYGHMFCQDWIARGWLGFPLVGQPQPCFFPLYIFLYDNRRSHTSLQKTIWLVAINSGRGANNLFLIPILGLSSIVVISWGFNFMVLRLAQSCWFEVEFMCLFAVATCVNLHFLQCRCYTWH